MRALRRFTRIFRSERGNVLVLCAATLPLMVGAVGLSVDTIHLSLEKRQLQRTADSGALAGAYAVVQGKPVSSSVTHDLDLNNDLTLTGAPVIENAPTTGAYAGNARAVRVSVSSVRSAPFMAVFNSTPTTLTAEATAAAVFLGKFCMISLENGNATGITFSGSTTVNLGCGVASNSKAAAAVSAGGSSTITASPIAAVGGVPTSSSYVQPTTLAPYSPSQADPYASLPIPAPPATCSPELKVQPNDARVTIPTTGGVACFRGMDIKGPVTLSPGTYYIDGGTVALGSQANLIGHGVTIILTSKTAATDPTTIATLSMHGSAIVDLTAPDTGTYSGVLMYQDPRATAGNTQLINGNSGSTFQGGFYFPKADLTFNGNTGMHTECLQLVARRLTFSGNSSVNNTCPANSGSKAFDAIFVRLVA